MSRDEFTDALLPGTPSRPPEPTKAAIRLIAYPALTDLLQTVLAQAGLLWVTSSTYQMMRGSVIVFTCLLSIRYMDKKMQAVHWTAISIVCVAIVLVGVAGLLGEDNEGSDAAQYILGIVLIVLGQVVGAVQFVLEEYLMVSMHVTPTLLVGWEGLWGTLYFVALAPLLTISPRGGGSASAIWHEDFIDTFIQLKNSDALIWLTVISGVALLVYNLVGNMVTKQLSAILRSILESCRTLGVWYAPPSDLVRRRRSCPFCAGSLASSSGTHSTTAIAARNGLSGATSTAVSISLAHSPES